MALRLDVGCCQSHRDMTAGEPRSLANDRRAPAFFPRASMDSLKLPILSPTPPRVKCYLEGPVANLSSEWPLCLVYERHTAKFS
jgi:hypothetical protein